MTKKTERGSRDGKDWRRLGSSIRVGTVRQGLSQGGDWGSARTVETGMTGEDSARQTDVNRDVVR